MPFPLYILLCVLPAFPRAYLIIYTEFFDSQEPGQEKIDVRTLLYVSSLTSAGVLAHTFVALKNTEKC